MRLYVVIVGCSLLAAACDVSGEQLDIDFNRLRVVPEARYQQKESGNPHRRSVADYPRRANDYDNRSGGARPAEATPLRRRTARYDAAPNVERQKGLRVYGAREDPRQFYQSRSYLQEALAKDDVVSGQMSGVYPELVTRLAGAVKDSRSPELRSLGRSSRYREWNSVSDYDEDMCLKCPAERTLIARPGVDKVLLQHPRLRTCSGRKPPRGVRFLRVYGPTFGSLLGAGSHVIVGKVMYKEQELHDCRFHVNVVTQLCQVPADLSAKCGPTNCNFTCADATLELIGSNSMRCNADLRWSGHLPVCRVRTWCYSPPPPDNGELSCQSTPAAGGAGLGEGSRCRAHCQPGWRAMPRGAASCRRGLWTHALGCKRRPAARRILHDNNVR